MANPPVGGVSTLFDADAANSAQAAKTSSGILWGVEVSNPNSADAYLQLFDLATGDVTVGTTTPKLSFLVPGGDGTLDGAMDKSFSDFGIAFNTAITYACATTAAGGSDPSAGLILNLLYQ